MPVSLESQTPRGQKVPRAKEGAMLESVTENKDILLDFLEDRVLRDPSRSATTSAS